MEESILEFKLCYELEVCASVQIFVNPLIDALVHLRTEMVFPVTRFPCKHVAVKY